METRIRKLVESEFNMNDHNYQDLHQFLSGEFYFFVDLVLSYDGN